MADPIKSMPFGYETVEIYPGPYAHGGRDSAYCVTHLEEAEKMAYDAIGIALELRKLAGKATQVELPLPRLTWR